MLGTSDQFRRTEAAHGPWAPNGDGDGAGEREPCYRVGQRTDAVCTPAA